MLPFAVQSDTDIYYVCRLVPYYNGNKEFIYLNLKLLRNVTYLREWKIFYFVSTC